MKISIKKIKGCNRREINTIYIFLGKLILEKNYKKLKKIKKITLIGLCKKNNKIIGMSAIKKPEITWIKKIKNESGCHIKKNFYEYGYVYVPPRYRGHGITKKIYKELEKRNNKIYVTTREDNYTMKKLLEQFGFLKKGNFTSNIDGKKVNIYLK